MLFKYIAGNNIQAALKVAHKLRERCKIPVFNYAVENVKNSLDTFKEFENISNYIDQNDKIAIKLSSFQYDKIMVNDLIDIYKEKKIKIIIDAESNEYKSLYEKTVNELISKHNKNECCVIKTYQMYRKDSYDILKEDIYNFRDIFHGTKLVRGAYWNSEVNHGHLYTLKNDTDINFNRGVLLLKNKKTNLFNILATHNSRSIDLGYAYNNENINFEFGHLLGMNENKYEELLINKQKVNVYIPYGPYHLMIPYLVRRLYENSDILKYV